MIKRANEVYLRQTEISASEIGSTAYFSVMDAAPGRTITRIAVYKFDRYIDAQHTVVVTELP